MTSQRIWCLQYTSNYTSDTMSCSRTEISVTLLWQQDSPLTPTDFCQTKLCHKRLWWSRGSVLAFSTQVHGFKPGQSRQIFKGEKILSAPSFRVEVKPSVPCRRFAACKRSLNVAWKSTFRQNYRTILAHKFHLSLLESLASCGCGGPWRRKWERLNWGGGGSGLHNKPAGCSASEA